MKNLFSRSGLALACALALAACGGGDGNLQLAGTINGLTKSGLSLSNNGGPALEILPGQSSFYFPKLLEADERFDVKTASVPAGTTCTVYNGTGRMGSYSLSNIQVVCVNVPRELSGTVVGLKGSGLVLNNGQIKVAVAPNAGSLVPFSFATKDSTGKITAGAVGQGEPFGVTVLTQPQGQTCTVAGGTGVMGENYSGVTVTCQP
jgi:hypothetical protein